MKSLCANSWFLNVWLGAFVCGGACQPRCEAMPASATPWETTQPDGTRISLHLQGDEFFHWNEDADGFTVVQENGRWVYAQLDAQNRLTPTAWQVGKDKPDAVGLTRRILPPPELHPRNQNQDLPLYRPWSVRTAAGAADRAKTASPAQGVLRNLVILCRFSDHTNNIHTRARGDYDVLFNQVGGDPVLAPTGSVRDAYDENSYGQVTIQSTVLDWIVLPQTEAYYAGTNNGRGFDYPNNAQRMVEDALALVDPVVNFAQFDANNDGYVDAITFIHSGYATEQGGSPGLIWSHRWWLNSDWMTADSNANAVRVKVFNYHTEAALFGTNGTAITRIGVICHELGHFFGLPDLYDTDSGTNKSSGIGNWCMMANSWGWNLDQLRPPHFSAWCKLTLGWISAPPILVPGQYSVNQTETTSAFAVLKVTQGFPDGEYLLIENRQPVGLDAGIPRGGLAVWHIDEAMGGNATEGFPGQSGWPGNGKHFRVALLQADGQYHLERGQNQGDAGDLWRSNGPPVLGLGTLPNTDTYQGGMIRPTAVRLSRFSAPDATMTLRIDFYARLLFINKDSPSSTQDGSFAFPFRTVQSAYSTAQDGDGLVFLGGGDYLVSRFDLLKRIGVESWQVIANLR